MRVVGGGGGGQQARSALLFCSFEGGERRVVGCVQGGRLCVLVVGDTQCGRGVLMLLGDVVGGGLDAASTTPNSDQKHLCGAWMWLALGGCVQDA